MRKRLIAIILLLSLCISLSACMGDAAGNSAGHDASEIFRVGDYPIFDNSTKRMEKRI